MCHRISEIHMWSFLKPDQLFPLKSRRNTLIWPWKLLVRQWEGFQHRHDAFTVAEARNANMQARLLFGDEVGMAASATAFKGGAESRVLKYFCRPKHLAC